MKILVEKAIRILKLILSRPQYTFIYLSLRAFTMIPPEWFVANLELLKIHKPPETGAIVECGTWKGGMIAGMARMLGKNREYYLFDSFEGLPPAKKIDGEAAIQWQKEKNPANYYNNCTASESDARAAMEKAGIQHAVIRKGWFNETLPEVSFEKGIAVLRMDADWYDSTMDIFNNLFDQVLPGGLILIDDYFTWEGCSRAVHDYLSKHERTERISSHNGVCYLVKS